MTDRKSLNKKVVVPAAAALLAVAMVGVIVLSPMSVMAQNSTNATNNELTAPNINGSVSVQNATNDFVKNNVKVTFTDAANLAKGQVPNGVLVGGRLSDVQGFLAYTFSVANYDSGTMKMVIIDAGNAQVLYTSNDLPLYNGGIEGGRCPGGPVGAEPITMALACIHKIQTRKLHLVVASVELQESQAPNMSKYATFFIYISVLYLIVSCAKMHPHPTKFICHPHV